jgi:PST family polysaccharide transporter
MEDRAVRGVPWTLLSYGVNRVVLVLTTVVLAHLLAPSDFGIVALAGVALAGLALVKDLGLGGTLIVRRDLDDHTKGTVLTLMMAGGLALALVAAAAAPLLAELFDEPELDGVLAALSLMLLIGGFTGFYEALLQSELEFRRRFWALLAQAAVISVTSIALAVADAGVWALVGGQVLGMVAFAAALVALTPRRIRPAFSRAAASDVFATGRSFLAQSVTSFLRQNADYVVVGQAFGSRGLGYYSMAYRLGEIPYLGVTEPVARVTFPGFARLRDRGQDVEEPFLKVFRLVALVCCLLGVMLSALAEPFTRVVFGDEWLPMAGALAVLGLWAAVRSVESTIAWLLNSIGLAGRAAAVSTIILIPLVPALVLAATWGDIATVAWVVLGDGLLSLVLLAATAHRLGGIDVRRQTRALLPVVGASAVAWAGARAVADWLADAPGAGLVAGGVAGILLYTALLGVIEPGILRTSLRQVARTVGRGREVTPAEPVPRG